MPGLLIGPAGLNGYPAEEDLQDFLAATGLITLTLAGDDALLNFGNALQAAIDEFERRTARKASGDAETRYFDPPDTRGILIPETPFATPDSVTYQGTALVRDEEYWLYPTTAEADGQPWQWIQFARRWNHPPLSGDRGQIAITAVWGSGLTVSADIWMAVLAGAADRLFTQVMLKQGGGRKSWTEDGVTETFDPQTLKQYQEMWRGQFDRACKVWRRLTVL